MRRHSVNKITRAITGAFIAIAAQSSFAQSSVTLYGIVDTSVRYLTNANANNDSQVAMGDGPITGSRWGLKGSEDLGDGLSAVFRLENGFNLWNGQLASANTLFNRMAYVGLSSNQYGAVTFGRQNTPLFDQLGNVYDPLTVGNYDQDGWLPGALGYGLRENNSVKYNGQFGGLTVAAMYSFGNVAGSNGANNMYGLNGVLHVRRPVARCRLPAEQRRAKQQVQRRQRERGLCVQHGQGVRRLAVRAGQYRHGRHLHGGCQLAGRGLDGAGDEHQPHRRRLLHRHDVAGHAAVAADRCGATTITRAMR